MSEENKYGGLETVDGVDVIIMYNSSSHYPLMLDMDLERAIEHMVDEDMFFKWVGDEGSACTEEDYYNMSSLLFGDVLATLDELNFIGLFYDRYRADGTMATNQDHITEYVEYLINAQREYRRENE